MKTKNRKKSFDVLTRTYLFLFAFMAFYCIYFIFVQCFVVNCDEPQEKNEIYFLKLPCCTIHKWHWWARMSTISINSNECFNIHLCQNWIANRSFLKVFLAHWQFFIEDIHKKNVHTFTHIHPKIKKKMKTHMFDTRHFVNWNRLLASYHCVFFYKYIKWGIYGISIRFYLVNVQKKHIFHFYAQLIVMKHR